MPVEISQTLSTLSESDVKTVPSFDCRVTDLISAEGEDAGFRSIMVWSVDWAPICQNLTDLSWDADIRVVEECHERNSDRSPNVPRGEERDDESGRQVDCLSDARWPDQ